MEGADGQKLKYLLQQKIIFATISAISNQHFLNQEFVKLKSLKAAVSS